MGQFISGVGLEKPSRALKNFKDFEKNNYRRYIRKRRRMSTGFPFTSLSKDSQ